MYEYFTVEEIKKQLQEGSKLLSSNYQLCYVERMEQGTYIAYFTPVSLDKQWGDDWDDAPYEHNAECPYDDHYEGDERIIKHTIKCIYFTPKEHCVLPEDYSIGGNSPFCVKDINNGAVAWLYNGKKAIYAGCGLFKFLDEIEDF